MSDPIYEFIDGIVDIFRGAQEQTQDDYSLCGPSEGGS
jgi:hypothetical protein